METEFSSDPGELMTTNDQLNSAICISQNLGLTLRNRLNSTTVPIGVKWTSSLLEGALFIVSNGTYQIIDIPNCWQHPADLLTHVFESVAILNNNSQDFFHGLIKAYADLYDIDLNLIVFDDNKYIIINKDTFLKPNEEPYHRGQHAFIWCNVDNTVYSPLYTEDINGCIITVFRTEEVFAWQYVESFVNQINQNVVNPDQNQAEQHSNLLEDLSHMVVDNTFSLPTNHSTSYTLQPQTTSGVPAVIGQILQQIYQLTTTLGPRLNEICSENQISGFDITNLDQISPQYGATLIQQRLSIISEIVQMTIEPIPQNNGNTISSNIVAEDNNQQGNTVQLNETNHSVQTDQNFHNIQPPAPVPTQLSRTIRVSQIIPASTPIHFQYGAPPILIQPKQKLRYRNMKDLGKKRIPLLAGDGPQRVLMRVKVPPQGTRQMHLGIKIQTYDNQEHRSKVPVPEHTNVDMSSFSNDNNLDRLQFDQCDQNDYFDPVNRHVYSAIGSAEYKDGWKDLRIHMFNLYQSGSITKELINTEQLGKCKLAFWLCILEDDVYKPISPPSLSTIIEET